MTLHGMFEDLLAVTVLEFENPITLVQVQVHPCWELGPSPLGRARGGGGKTYRKAEPHEDGPSETIFRDPSKAVSEVVS